MPRKKKKPGTPDLFEHAAQAAKRDGMHRAEVNATPEWKEFMLEQARLVCLEQPRFTSDDVFERASNIPNAPETHDHRAFGPVMMRAAKLGYCRATKTVVPSNRASNHKRPVALWESLICESRRAA